MLKVLHNDNDYIICQKDAGVLSEHSQCDKNNMPSFIAEYLSEKEESVYPVHRLDSIVGGIMVYALNKKCAAHLSRIISENAMQKCYLAVIHGCPDEEKGVFKDLLFKDSRKNKSFVVNRMRKGVKEASLEYEVLKTAEYDGKIYSLVKILLHTGRTHQIRVQFSSRKMPLVGDRRYGSGKDDCSIALWSYSLSFPDLKSEDTKSFFLEPDWDIYPWNILNGCN